MLMSEEDTLKLSRNVKSHMESQDEHRQVENSHELKAVFGINK